MNYIIAPSASGKTHFICSHTWLKDADNIRVIKSVYARLGALYGERWWTGIRAKEQLAHKDALMRGAFARLHSVQGWCATAELMASQYRCIFVIPLPETLVEQSIKRGIQQQPIWSLEQANQQVSTYECAAKRARTLIFKSFDDLAAVKLA